MLVLGCNICEYNLVWPYTLGGSDCKDKTEKVHIQHNSLLLHKTDKWRSKSIIIWLTCSQPIFSCGRKAQQPKGTVGDPLENVAPETQHTKYAFMSAI